MVFDVNFDGLEAIPADREFAQTIRANGRVVLAAELNGWQRQAGKCRGVTSLSPVLPYAVEGPPPRAGASRVRCRWMRTSPCTVFSWIRRWRVPEPHRGGRPGRWRSRVKAAGAEALAALPRPR